MFNSNASSADAGGADYIEDVFSTWLYTGNGTSQTITNGIDLAGEGGLTWIKDRTFAYDNVLFDTVRGATKLLYSNATSAESTIAQSLTSFNSNGFSVGANGLVNTNINSDNYVSWTFRKQPKFFDVVTFTGNGSGSQFVNHNLQSSYGFIVIKRTDSTSDWFVLAKESSADSYWQLKLNSTAAYTGLFGADPNTSTGFFPSSVIGAAAVNGGTYVAYLFAHNAGGFGLTGTDNVISCGSFTTSTVSDTITLGYEPQWVLAKAANSATNWYIFDNMRGLPTGGSDLGLKPNSSAAESADANFIDLTATGFISNFQAVFGDGINIIYIAIRRGPMKVPTDGTKVYTNAIQTTGTTPTTSTTGFPVDLIIQSQSPSATNKFWSDRLRGSTTNSYNYVLSNATSAEATGAGGGIGFDNNTGFANNLLSPNPLYDWCFRRAPGFFDEVCYTGTGSATAYNHNLGVVPELVIVKSRSTTYDWYVIQQPAGGGTGPELLLNTSGASLGSVNWSSIANATTFTPYSFYGTPTGASGQTFVAYLFATCPGVSKVGSYTGTGTTQTINCGFTGGARFVLIKRTDSTGDWYVWDSARGIVAGNDPYLLLNSTAAEVTSTDYVDTYAAGFELTSTAPAALNASGGTYIFLAIA